MSDKRINELITKQTQKDSRKFRNELEEYFGSEIIEALDLTINGSTATFEFRGRAMRLYFMDSYFHIRIGDGIFAVPLFKPDDLLKYLSGVRPA